MIKKIFYFFQSVFIYLFYLLSKIIGLKLSRMFFSLIFRMVGNLFKSKNIVLDNLERIKPDISDLDKEIIINKMWSNYGKTFVEYIFLNIFKKKSDHIEIKNKKIIDEIIKINEKRILLNFKPIILEIRYSK